MIQIINELNQENGSNYKMDVLRKHKDNELLKKVLKMTYDRVAFTYGISLKNIPVIENNNAGALTLEEAVNYLDKLADRTYTGNAARDYLTNILNSLDEVQAQLIKNIINRDLRINTGRSNINKVFKNLIVKPPYMRCGIYSEKTAKKINFPAILQLKADGMYQTATVENNNVVFSSRSGEEREFPVLKQQYENYPDGVYIGELLVKGLENRSEGNGLINSDNPPHDKIVHELWDFVTLEEYSRGKDKNNKTLYRDRLQTLRKNIENSSNIELIKTVEVDNIKEALAWTSKWMNAGLEGSILKDENNIFVDHTSPTQLKLKLEIDAEVRITGFLEGTPGTKREKTFGSIVFETDDGKVKGKTSGFTDSQLEDFNKRREELIGKIITVQFNDLTQARGNDYYALSHPRFMCIRPDKDQTDTLERIVQSKNMAMMLS